MMHEYKSLPGICCWDDAQTHKFWSDYYQLSSTHINPSDFAQYCIKFIRLGSKIIDLGCGNGRDSIFFATQGCQVIACDACPEAISALPHHDDLHGIIMNFSDMIPINNLDVAYARFVLHAIDEQQAYKLLTWCYNYLKPQGLLCLEARTIQDSLYGQGTKIAKHSFVTDHYRRFIDPHDLRQDLVSLNFKLLKIIEGQNLSVTPQENPCLIRIIAQKQ